MKKKVIDRFALISILKLSILFLSSKIQKKKLEQQPQPQEGEKKEEKAESTEEKPAPKKKKEKPVKSIFENIQSVSNRCS